MSKNTAFDLAGKVIAAIILFTLMGLAFGLAALTWRWAWGIL